MSDHNNPDKAHGNLQDNIPEITKSKRDIYQRLREFSTLDGATILQLDATMIIGVLFFLTLASSLGAADVERSYNISILTSTVVLPFTASAILILLANKPLQVEILSHFKKESLQPMNEKDYRRMARNSKVALHSGLDIFFYARNFFWADVEYSEGDTRLWGKP